MAAGVAHEIKNPLGSMSIHLQLMDKLLERDKFDRDNFKKYLSIINDEVERLNSIVVDYLFAVRPMDIELSEGNVNRLINELIEFTQYELDESKIDVNLELDDTICAIFMDKKFMKQALLNIIKNSIQAMEMGGKLSIKTEMVEGMVMLSIGDTGVGMDLDTQEKIFEPHFTTKDTGSGLGLTIVYKVIKEHKGDIRINSTPGEGTTFTFIFPGVCTKETLLLN